MFHSNLVNIKNPMCAFVAGAASRKFEDWSYAVTVTKMFDDSTNNTKTPEILMDDTGTGVKFAEHGHLTGQLHAVMVAVWYAKTHGADRIYVVEQDGQLPDETTEMYKAFKHWLDKKAVDLDVVFLSREALSSAPQRALLDKTARRARNTLTNKTRTAKTAGKNAR